LEDFILTLFHYFFDLTFLEARAEILKKIVGFFGRFEDTQKDILKSTDLQLLGLMEKISGRFPEHNCALCTVDYSYTIQLKGRS
jgi:hypothetical protein